MHASKVEVEAIRSASRRLVRALGFMSETLAGTTMSPSAVHALLELGAGRIRSANDLAEVLRLEKSSVSRLLRKLVDGALVKEKPAEGDGRKKLLSLTSKGKEVLAGIDRFARKQVVGALGHLSEEQRASVIQGLDLYAAALAGEPTGDRALQPVRVRHGYSVGVFARCIEMHARFYAQEHGFGRAFEAVVAGGLAEFSKRMDKPCNRLWWATQGDRVVGTIAIDGEDLGTGAAHLRWFIVEQGLRGAGLGRRLLSEALQFCDRQKFAETHLWTFKGLDAARRLYEAHGFVLSEERPGAQWGKEVLEQRFVRKGPG